MCCPSQSVCSQEVKPLQALTPNGHPPGPALLEDQQHGRNLLRLRPGHDGHGAHPAICRHGVCAVKKEVQEQGLHVHHHAGAWAPLCHVARFLICKTYSPVFDFDCLRLRPRASRSLACSTRSRPTTPTSRHHAMLKTSTSSAWVGLRVHYVGESSGVVFLVTQFRISFQEPGGAPSVSQ